MIKSFSHKGLQLFFLTGSKAGIQPHHAIRLKLLLANLNQAKLAVDMKLPGLDWHELKGHLKGHYSVSVNGNWRLIFTFEGEDAILVNYLDYH